MAASTPAVTAPRLVGNQSFGVIESDDQWKLSIRYEGGDAESHSIDLSQLGQSLQGMARVLAVSAHFAQTGNYNKQYDTLSVKVVAQPVEEHHCYEVSAAVMKVITNGDVLWSGIGTALFMAVVGYVFNRRKEEELKHLSEALQKSLGQQGETQARLLATIEKLADALQPAARQALAPVGQSVSSINIRPEGNTEASVTLDAATKALSAASKYNAITEMRIFSGVISELDMISGACKVALDSDPETRVASIITDPIVTRPRNRYAEAMSNLLPVKISAKAEVNQDDEIVKLYISDITE